MNTELEKLREALAVQNVVHNGDLHPTLDNVLIGMAASDQKGFPWSENQYAALAGYRSRDAEVKKLQDEITWKDAEMDAAMAAEIATLQADKAELVKALEAFAAEADNWCESVPDRHRSLCNFRIGNGLYCGRLSPRQGPPGQARKGGGMKIPIHLDLPESEDPRVQALAVEYRTRELRDLLECYPFEGALIYADGSGVEVVPETLVSPEKRGAPAWKADLQMTIGGLVLELCSMEKYWNKASSYEHLEQQINQPSGLGW